MHLIIKEYNSDYEQIWDNFVAESFLGTIYHTRKFINYHPEGRFIDNSILIYNNNELICVLPCCSNTNIKNINKKQDNKVGQNTIEIDQKEFSTCNLLTYFSYTGATYGGPVIAPKYYKTKYLIPIIEKIFNFYNNRIEFRLANNIYFEESSYLIQYLLSRKLTMKPELSWYVNTEDNFINNIKNKRNRQKLNNMIKNNPKCYITENINDYIEYYKILTEMLNQNHNTKPTHSLEEFLSLKKILETKQLLFICKKNNVITGGVYIIKVTKKCWYSFYISRNIKISNSVIDVIYIMYTITNEARNNNVQYIDYGICTENKGEFINIGLANFKEESLGGISNYRYLLFVKYIMTDLFDWKFYINEYPDLQKANIDNYEKAFAHWNEYGKKEKRLGYPNLQLKSHSTKCICTCIKNEHDFINNWLEYHINIGIDYFYILIDNIFEEQEEYIIADEFKNKIKFIKVDSDLVAKTLSNNNQPDLTEVMHKMLNILYKHVKEDWVICCALDNYIYIENLTIFLDNIRPDCTQIMMPWISIINPLNNSIKDMPYCLNNTENRLPFYYVGNGIMGSNHTQPIIKKNNLLRISTDSHTFISKTCKQIIYLNNKYIEVPQIIDDPFIIFHESYKYFNNFLQIR